MACPAGSATPILAVALNQGLAPGHAQRLARALVPEDAPGVAVEVLPVVTVGVTEAGVMGEESVHLVTAVTTSGEDTVDVLGMVLPAGTALVAVVVMAEVTGARARPLFHVVVLPAAIQGGRQATSAEVAGQEADPTAAAHAHALVTAVRPRTHGQDREADLVLRHGNGHIRPTLGLVVAVSQGSKQIVVVLAPLESGRELAHPVQTGNECGLELLEINPCLPGAAVAAASNCRTPSLAQGFCLRAKSTASVLDALYLVEQKRETGCRGFFNHCPPDRSPS